MTDTDELPRIADREPSELERELRTVIVGMADVLARLMVDEMSRNLGGQEVYVPAADRAARNAAIRAAYLDGSPDRSKRLVEVAKQFGVSPRTVLRVSGRR